MFTWIPIHREAIHRILEYRQNQNELLTILREMEQKGLKVISLQDKGADGETIPLAEIDPFSFLATFNRGVTDKNRRDNWAFLKARWGLKAPVPDDFGGIPTLNNMRCRLMPWAKDREEEHVERLWRVASLAADGSIEQVGAEAFDQCLNLPLVGMASLTIGLFWINPEKFLSGDSKTTAYGKAKGITTEPEDYQSYRQWLTEMTGKLGNNYPQVSHAAHLFATEPRPPEHPSETGLALPFRAIFTSTEEAHFAFDLFRSALTALGVEPDAYEDDTRIALTMPMPQSPPTIRLNFGKWAILSFLRPENSAVRVQFLCQRDMIPPSAEDSPDAQFADLIDEKSFALVSVAPERMQTESGAERAAFLASLAKAAKQFEHWKGSTWRKAHRPELLRMVFNRAERDRLLRQGLADAAPSPVQQYWWLNANPTIWNLQEMPVGHRETYTSHNEEGNKRQKYKYFQEAKPGDMVVGYATGPQKEVVAFCKITKGLHQTEDGETIEIEKVEHLEKPIPSQALKANPDLARSEPIINHQGSLFRLTEREYLTIRSLIDEKDIQVKTAIEPYDKEKAMKGLFLDEAQFDNMLEALREKKNVVLQGAPGVGKTYVARRLAYALVGSNDPQRIEIIQFHQSYSYEDFIQGFRPTPEGRFALKHGICYEFCRRAQRDEAQGTPYVFIIDEINRGNLSKIFGELMMLIEPDKRGKEYAIPLTYSQDADEKFYIPENLHLIGMMNTADRSLAMVDYALRRRFRFITLRPAFSSEAFRSFLDDRGVMPGLAEKIVKRMNALNKAIAEDTKNLGAEYQIGHSYFCPQSGIIPDEDWYRRVIEFEIVPLIEEYWFDDPKTVEKHQHDLLA